MAKFNAVAEKSKQLAPEKPKAIRSSTVTSELNAISQSVKEYFADSKAILIRTKDDLHEYITRCIDSGYAGIDTETTGLDRLKDWIVGASLYYPGGTECYIPMKHITPIFDSLYKDQLTYEEVQEEFQLLADSNIKLIFANADYDLAMIYKDLKVDLNDRCYYDVILAWRCLKENELHNDLKSLYNKYVLRGVGDPKKFSDFFSVQLFPYCQPEVAKLYAANDAKITYDLFVWQLPYLTPSHPKCKKAHLEGIANLVWNVEFPLIKVCQNMHRTGVYLQESISDVVKKRYFEQRSKEMEKLQSMVQDILDETTILSSVKQPFRTGKEFNPNSTVHVKYLLCDVMKVLQGNKLSTGKEVLHELNLPVTNQILVVRSYDTLIGTFVDKLPRTTWPDNRIHCQMKQIGANTGRMCIAEDVLVTCLNGEKPIKDIRPGDLVYCYDDNGGIHLSPVKNIWKTGTNRECVTIKWQSSGNGDIGYLTCTPEHPIRLKSGEWVRADSLKRYDKLAHLRRTCGRRPDRRPDLYGWNGLATREQDVVKTDIFHADTSMSIHHKDNNPQNNDLSNLEILTASEHAKVTVAHQISTGSHTTKGLRTKASRLKRMAAQRNLAIAKHIDRRNEYLEDIRLAKGRISNIPHDFENFKKACIDADIDIIHECARYNTRYAKRAFSVDKFNEAWAASSGDITSIANILDTSIETVMWLCKKYDACMNHMVQSVEYAGKFDVYDIEVENYHNFIAGEINVHNSSATPNMQNIPSHATDIRHFFRATPKEKKSLSYETENDTLELDLNELYEVKLADGSWCRVMDLKENNVVTFKEGNTLRYLRITSISDSEGQYHICLAVENQI